MTRNVETGDCFPLMMQADGTAVGAVVGAAVKAVVGAVVEAVVRAVVGAGVAVPAAGARLDVHTF